VPFVGVRHAAVVYSGPDTQRPRQTTEPRSDPPRGQGAGPASPPWPKERNGGKGRRLGSPVRRRRYRARAAGRSYKSRGQKGSIV
jgi:hypothetical protein